MLASYIKSRAKILQKEAVLMDLCQKAASVSDDNLNAAFFRKSLSLTDSWQPTSE